MLQGKNVGQQFAASFEVVNNALPTTESTADVPHEENCVIQL